MSEIDTTRYELPAAGITLLGYIVRRMHKTKWLIPVPGLIAANQTEQALSQIALYAVAASTSFGRAYYQPVSDRTGEEIAEPDPETGVVVRAKLDSISPNYRISYSASLPDGSAFTGREEIKGTEFSHRGLGMPAPSMFHFHSGSYSADLSGILTTELTVSLFRRSRICAYGHLGLEDSTGNRGHLDLNRSGDLSIRINSHPVRQYSLAGPLATRDGASLLGLEKKV